MAIYSKVSKEKVSRWLRVRADIRPRSGASAAEGSVVPMTLFSPPFYSLSKLNTTMSELAAGPSPEGGAAVRATRARRAHAARTPRTPLLQRA